MQQTTFGKAAMLRKPTKRIISHNPRVSMYFRKYEKQSVVKATKLDQAADKGDKKRQRRHVLSYIRVVFLLYQFLLAATYSLFWLSCVVRMRRFLCFFVLNMSRGCRQCRQTTHRRRFRTTNCMYNYVHTHTQTHTV